MNKILLVGGVDNSGGAGILADKETLVTLGSGAAVAVTAITVQSDDRFHDSHSVPAVILEKQLNSINLDEIGAIKIGMLPFRFHRSIGGVSYRMSNDARCA